MSHKYDRYGNLDECMEQSPGASYYITVTHGLRGYFAVMVVRDPDGFEEPMQTSPVTGRTREDAVKDAIAWAEAEGMEVRV